METRALIATRRVPRALYAGVVLVALLAGLLGAWFASGWHDVRLRQREVTQAPVLAAQRRAEEIARDLHGELEALFGRETKRRYFEYQNLMHAIGATPGPSVAPSPLSTGPDDKLVVGYFQIDAQGRTTTPTINDELPERSDHEHLVENRAFRDQVVRDLSRELVPPPTPVVAAALPRPKQQVIQIDPNVYLQNATANAVYVQQLETPPKPAPRPPPPAPAPPRGPVTITTLPFEWRTLVFAGKPALVAVRNVFTPDGARTQGFVIDRSTWTSGLAAKAGEMVAELHAGGTDGVDVAPGWRLSVAPNPRTMMRAATDASELARGFLIRFVAIGAAALVAAAFVVWLVMQAEQLARERSQFAAAAAHELRTPLAGLQLYGDMLADGLGDPGKMRDYARRMSEEAARLGRVVSNVLGFSQLERGNLTVNAQVGALGETLCDLAERVQPALDRAGAVLDLDVARELRARFDPDALARIVANLLDNAEKYGRAAADRTIQLAAHDKGDIVEVVVADRGPGVTDAARLFRAFARGVTADGPAGLGLGLALSRSLARAMGGELAYRPNVGGGAAFTLCLPRA